MEVSSIIQYGSIFYYTVWKYLLLYSVKESSILQYGSIFYYAVTITITYSSTVLFTCDITCGKTEIWCHSI